MSSLQGQCPTCKGISNLYGPITHDGTNGNDMWLCYACDAVICTRCYIRHAGESHPESGVPSSAYTEQMSQSAKKKKRKK